MDSRPDPATAYAVSSLLAEYCATMDSGRFDEWVELFLTDGRLELPPAVIAGHAKLTRFAERAPVGIHVSGLPLLATTPDSISSVCSWVFVERATGTAMAGYYYDDIVWAGGRYRFRARRVAMQASPVKG